MIHACPINYHSDNSVAISRVVRVAGALNEQSSIDSDTFADTVFSIGMYKMTQDEINMCDRYRQYSPHADGSCSGIYCVALSAVVITRENRYTFRHRSAKKIVDEPLAYVLRSFVDGIHLSTREAEFIIAYIHNELHNGPHVLLPADIKARAV